MNAPARIGDRVARVEDKRFVTGAGRYTDDIDRPGQAYAVFVRSPHAHARIRSVDRRRPDRARRPAVYAGRDIKRFSDERRHLRGGDRRVDLRLAGPSKDGAPMKAGAHPALAKDKVNYVGDAVAVVVAETLAQAKDAAELIAVDYEVLEPLVDLATAQASGRPEVHDGIGRNTAFDWELGDKGATEAAFARAAHVTRLDLVNNRLIPNAMEPRAAIGEYDPGEDSFTLYVTSQNPHVARLVLSAFVGLAPEHKLRVIAPDVGGGFGSKIFIYAEEVVCLWAARRLKRPVKWTGDRSEAFLADAHGRDHVTRAELATDERGKILGLRVKTLANMGAYLSTFALVGADLSLRDAAVRPIRHSGDLRGSGRGLHQHGARRRLPGRRSAGGDLSWSSAWSRRRRANSGSTGRDPAAATSSTQFPHQTPVHHDLRRRRLRGDAGQGARARRLRGLRRRVAAIRPERQAAGPRLLRLHRGLRPRALEGGRLARRRRGPVGIGGGARQSDRHGGGAHRFPQPRPGP